MSFKIQKDELHSEIKLNCICPKGFGPSCNVPSPARINVSLNSHLTAALSAFSDPRGEYMLQGLPGTSTALYEQ